MKKFGLLILAISLTAVMAFGFAGCGVKISNLDAIEAEYLVAVGQKTAKEQIYPSKTGSMSLEQVYVKWFFFPAKNVAVQSLQFKVKLMDTVKAAEEAEKSDFNIDIAVNVFDRDQNKVIPVYLENGKKVTFGETVDIRFTEEVVFARDVPKEFAGQCNVEITFNSGANQNSAVKFTLTDIQLGTK